MGGAREDGSAVDTFESDFEGSQSIETVRSDLDSVPEDMSTGYSTGYSIMADLQMASSRYSVLSEEVTMDGTMDGGEHTDDEGQTDEEASMGELIDEAPMGDLMNVMSW